MDEWIHVDDRLPDTEDVVLVFVQYPGHKKLAHTTKAWLCEGEEWLEADGSMELEVSDKINPDVIKPVVLESVVTHWRPYVEPTHPTTGILE